MRFCCCEIARARLQYAVYVRLVARRQLNLSFFKQKHLFQWMLTFLCHSVKKFWDFHKKIKSIRVSLYLSQHDINMAWEVRKVIKEFSTTSIAAQIHTFGWNKVGQQKLQKTCRKNFRSNHIFHHRIFCGGRKEDFQFFKYLCFFLFLTSDFFPQNKKRNPYL